MFPKYGFYCRIAGRLAAGAVIAGLSVPAAIASDPGGAVEDPFVLGPDRFSDDVSAFYVGLSGGYASGGSDRFGLGTNIGTFPIGDLSLTGSLGGLRAGWRGILPARGGRDYVYGVEIGYDQSSMDDDATTDVAGTIVQGGSEIASIASLRFRNGLTNPSGSILYFLTLGVVRGDIRTTANITNGSGTQSFADKDQRNGLVASIGAEHKLSDNWSVTGEFEYGHFDSKVIDFGSGFSTKSTPSYRALRFGLNYQF